MAIEDVYVLTLSARSTAGIVQNSLAFIRTSSTEPIAGDFGALAVAIKDIHRSRQSTGLTYESWKARQVRGVGVTWPTGNDCNPVGGNLFEGLITSNGQGQLAGDGLPPQCALVTTIRTAKIGRRRRGRFFAGGFTETDQNNGVWGSTILTPVDAAWLAFFNTYTVAAPTGGNRLGIWSFRTASGCVANPTGKGHTRVDSPAPEQAFEPATTYTLRPTVYTQRRRVTGVGR